MSPFALHIIFILLFDLTGATCAKLWSVHQHWGFLVSTGICFGMAGILFARSLKYEGLAITNIIWASTATISITLIGYIAFKEHITPLQFTGMSIALLGIILINL